MNENAGDGTIRRCGRSLFSLPFQGKFGHQRSQNRETASHMKSDTNGSNCDNNGDQIFLFCHRHCHVVSQEVVFLLSDLSLLGFGSESGRIIFNKSRVRYTWYMCTGTCTVLLASSESHNLIEEVKSNATENKENIIEFASRMRICQPAFANQRSL
jgi:hypothetical protein